MKELTHEARQLLNDILDYIEDSEAIDFEEQCIENNITPQEIITGDNTIVTNHIYYTAVKLRQLLKEN